MIRDRKQNTQTQDPNNLLLEHGLAEGLAQIAEMLMNNAMLIERSAHLDADLYGRRNEPDRPSLLKSGSRSDQSLKLVFNAKPWQRCQFLLQ